MTGSQTHQMVEPHGTLMNGYPLKILPVFVLIQIAVEVQVQGWDPGCFPINPVTNSILRGYPECHLKLITDFLFTL